MLTTFAARTITDDTFDLRNHKKTHGDKPMIPTHRPPTHPGEMLLEEFLAPMNLAQKDAAEKMGISSAPNVCFTS